MAQCVVHISISEIQRNSETASCRAQAAGGSLVQPQSAQPQPNPVHEPNRDCPHYAMLYSDRSPVSSGKMLANYN
jgi:hypothetical protein